MEESDRIRRASEPIELVKLVKRIKHEFSSDESLAELPPAVKHKITDEILQRLRSLRPNASISDQQGESLYIFIKGIVHKLADLMTRTSGNTSNTNHGSKRPRIGMTESYGQAGVRNDQIGSNWDWDDDDRGIVMDIQSLLSEFGDFGDFFENDVLPFGELFYLSGILTVFFCGIVMSHYTWHNVTESSRVTTKPTMSLMVSSILLAWVMAERAAFVFPLSYLANLSNKSSENISFREQIIIWWAGLMRGAVSMALAYRQIMPL